MPLRLALCLLVSVASWGFGQTSLTVFLEPEDSLVLPNGTVDREMRDLVLVNDADRSAALALSPTPLVPSGVELKFPLTLGPHREALLRLQWSQVLRAWWVQAYLVAPAKSLVFAKPARNLLSPARDHPRWDWSDDSYQASRSFLRNCVAITLPPSRELTWSENHGPWVASSSSFAPSLQGDWVLETKLNGPVQDERHSKSSGAMGVIFADGSIVCVMLQNFPRGRLVGLGPSPSSAWITEDFPETTAFLRLRRSGENYTLEYSRDGREWTRGKAGQDHPGDPVSIRLGVEGWSGLAPDAYIFEYLTLTPVK